ncbi:MAG: hypothetical protein H0T78_11895 [Longispora sp.]|nr:hypothetical protein [Longispora sp. (in: high G+C Gram-positive bacteria)]
MTEPSSLGTVDLMPMMFQRLDADRRRRRLQLLAERAEGKVARERAQVHRSRSEHVRELIAIRRRQAA